MLYYLCLLGMVWLYKRQQLRVGGHIINSMNNKRQKLTAGLIQPVIEFQSTYFEVKNVQTVRVVAGDKNMARLVLVKTDTITPSTDYTLTSEGLTVHCDYVTAEVELTVSQVNMLNIRCLDDVYITDIKASLDVQTVNGDIQLQKVCSLESDFHTVNGNIEINGCHLYCGIGTVSGDIVLKETTLESCKIKTVSGDVSLFDISEAERLVIETVSGDVALADVRCKGDIKVKTVSGDLQAINCKPRFHTTSGKFCKSL
jgi:DUF4097 and DUF4098 domain-containing protein YvlB